MLMIETFECTETTDESSHDGDAAKELINKMGLLGQVRREGTTDKPRNPFRMMNNDELFAYRVHCPSSVKAANYTQSPIPLRVLKLMEFAVDADHFNTEQFYIWDRNSALVTDPVLVVQREEPVEGQSFKRTVFYILARWGDELKPFSVLLKDALAMKRKQIEDDLCSIRSKTSALLDGGLTDSMLIANGGTGSVYAYGYGL